ncbi:MAG TPA: hypothetical protein VFB80_20285 [Pirellulaceae bacterium]|nr:hypothetical protein [Pirellulaceae bacterium]
MNPPAPVREAQQALVATLRREVGRLEGVRPPEDDRPLSTGVEALDRLLPAGGLRRGTLVEYLSPGSGCGAPALALAAAREACRPGRALVVLDCSSRLRRKRPATESRATGFYPPAAAAWGIDLSRLLILRPANEADALWALDQALRCPGVGAVWAACDRLDVRDFRRLQLAAETGGTLGLLLREGRLRGQPTWADVQWRVSPRCRERPLWRSGRADSTSSPRGSALADHRCAAVPASLTHPTWRLRVELLRCRGGAGGQSVVLELDETAATWREATDHAPHSLPVAAELADSAPVRRA